MQCKVGTKVGILEVAALCSYCMAFPEVHSKGVFNFKIHLNYRISSYLSLEKYPCSNNARSKTKEWLIIRALNTSLQAIFEDLFKLFVVILAELPSIEKVFDLLR